MLCKSKYIPKCKLSGHHRAQMACNRATCFRHASATLPKSMLQILSLRGAGRVVVREEGCRGCVGRMLGRYWGVLGDYSECLGEILAGYSNNPTENGSAQASNVASSNAGSNAEKRTNLGLQHSFMQRMLQRRSLLARNFRQASACFRHAMVLITMQNNTPFATVHSHVSLQQLI